MNNISRFLESIIGIDRPYPSLRALAKAAGMEPSSVLRPLSGAVMGPVNTQKILRALNPPDRAAFIAAILRDYVPSEYLQEILNGQKLKLKIEADQQPYSPLARKTLMHLTSEACRSKQGEACLEQLGRWMGLADEVEV